MSEPARYADGTINPHGHLRQAIADAIRERLEASEKETPGGEPPQPWDHEPEYDGLVSIYELADAVLSAVLATSAGPVRPDEEPT
ncbi:hypothetical protein [Streptomyces cupreus]|uniref:Uncharacterized protein n=1 Tax=Streptomyces cupreus TaxID=2759956 RepID=A0A7X1M9Y0_9ACTN|nr:hypothetical protein [Streptomyces cupreus]MBC2903158.1 hypothetical protein [Streptomyces cupreus]